MVGVSHLTYKFLVRLPSLQSAHRKCDKIYLTYSNSDMFLYKPHSHAVNNFCDDFKRILCKLSFTLISIRLGSILKLDGHFQFFYGVKKYF